MTERLLRLPEVLSRVGVSRATLYRWEAAGKFVPRVKLSGGVSVWPESKVQAWIEQVAA
jgi:prophage regulatory protein